MCVDGSCTSTDVHSPVSQNTYPYLSVTIGNWLSGQSREVVGTVFVVAQSVGATTCIAACRIGGHHLCGSL